MTLTTEEKNILHEALHNYRAEAINALTDAHTRNNVRALMEYRKTIATNLIEKLWS